MTRLLAINGSYREGGATDQAVAAATEAAAAAGAAVETVNLRDVPIAFCSNCRQCGQVPGDAPAQCVHQDAMRDLIAGIESADGLILASPTNLSSVTALFKRFMERLAVYGYWPWGAPAPTLRRNTRTKKALLITSSAAPGLLGRIAFSSLRQLKMTAKTVGAKPVGTVWIGLMSQRPAPELPPRSRARIQRLARRLV